MLRGLVYCSCGARMRGDTRRSRGKEWRYYTCPVSDGRSNVLGADGALVECHARRVPADRAEDAVVAAIPSFALPAEAVAQAREELRRRLRAPQPGVADKERARLKTRVLKLAELYSWGDLDEAEYRRQKADAERQLSLLPDNDKLVRFDRHRAVIATLAENVEAASKERLQELVALLVERIETAEQHVVRVEWVPAARPFFAREAAVAGDSAAPSWRPWTDSNRRRRP